MDGMTVSKLQIDVSKNQGKAGELARFLDSTPRGLNTYLLKNLWAICHGASHVLFRGLARISRELSEGAVADDLPLFDVPEDHAMTVREIEEWIEGFKGLIIGDYVQDHTGKGEFELNAGGIPAKVKAAIAAHGDAGLTRAEVHSIFQDDGVASELVESYLWAMVHTGELWKSGDEEEERLVATDPDLALDIMEMVSAQPGLGTEEGVGEIKPIPLGVPDLVDEISIQIFAGDGATFDALVEKFEDRDAVDRAVSWLIHNGKVECFENDEDGSDVRYMPFGQDLDNLHGDTLRAVYERETGEKAGRKGEARMREEISKARELRRSKRDQEEHGDESAEGDAAEAEDDGVDDLPVE